MNRNNNLRSTAARFSVHGNSSGAPIVIPGSPSSAAPAPTSSRAPPVAPQTRRAMPNLVGSTALNQAPLNPIEFNLHETLLAMAGEMLQMRQEINTLCAAPPAPASAPPVPPAASVSAPALPSGNARKPRATTLVAVAHNKMNVILAKHQK